MRYRWTGESWDSAEGFLWPDLGGRFDLVTWNLWFDAHLREQRCQAIATELARIRPELMGFQEATLAMLRPFFAMEWLQKDYWCSASPASPPDSHGVVLWGRVQPVHFERRLLMGNMGRRALLCDLGRLRLGVVHLESTQRNAETREAQLRQLEPLLAPPGACLLVGDFNFCASGPEGQRMVAGMRDAWSVAHPQEPGWTIDPLRNPLLRPGPPARLDRVLVRDLEVEAMHLLGTENLASDHFGLHVQLSRSSGIGKGSFPS